MGRSAEENPSEAGISHRRARARLKRGPYACVAVCSERDGLGPIADVLTAKALRGNGILVARDFAGADGALA